MMSHQVESIRQMPTFGTQLEWTWELDNPLNLHFDCVSSKNNDR